MNREEQECSTSYTKPWTWGAALCVFLAFAYAQAYAGAAPGIKVVGNQFVTTSAGTLGLKNVSANQAVVLRGINVSGQEYSCLDAVNTVWDSSSLPNGTGDYQKVTATGMVSDWHANVVRIPLNEDCWLNEPSNNPPLTGGSTYTSAIVNFVKTANANGLVAEVDLHVGAGPALAQDGCCVDSFPAMDTNYSLQFWQSVATTFAANPAVIFNLTNEPEFPGDGSNGESESGDWTCYLNGGCNTSVCAINGCQGPNGSGNTWNVEGVASVVTAIRNAEAAAHGVSHVIIIAGLNYSNQLNDWLTYVPQYVSDRQIAAGIHLYYDIVCTTSACWNSTWTPILNAGYPVVIDETGELTKKNGGHGCTGTDTKSMVSWANSQSPQVGYWFWAFNSNSCSAGPGLLNSNTTFAPQSGYGAAAQSALKAIQ
jgi:endoglucanase